MTLKDLTLHGWSVYRKENTDFFDLYMQSFIARIKRHNTKFRVIDVHANVEFPFVSDVSTLVAQIQYGIKRYLIPHIHTTQIMPTAIVKIFKLQK